MQQSILVMTHSTAASYATTMVPPIFNGVSKITPSKLHFLELLKTIHSISITNATSKSTERKRNIKLCELEILELLDSKVVLCDTVERQTNTTVR